VGDRSGRVATSADHDGLRLDGTCCCGRVAACCSTASGEEGALAWRARRRRWEGGAVATAATGR